MVTIGSARINELVTISGGKAGDQTGREVAQEEFYVHSLGWVILRAKNAEHAARLAHGMRTACNNDKIGYSQTTRNDIMKSGIFTSKPTTCDCSSLVRAIVKYACGVDVGSFTTHTEKSVLLRSGLFDAHNFYNITDLREGDILVTPKKGHTVIVTSIGDKPTVTGYYPAYKGNSKSIVDALIAVGEYKTTFANRKRIARANGLPSYTGTARENLHLLSLLSCGKLKKN